jgi:outer membrane protein TolC
MLIYFHTPMKTIVTSCFIIILFFLIGTVASQAEIFYLDLKTARKLALKGNPDLLRSAMDLQSAESSYKAIRSTLYPSLKIDLSTPNYSESLSEQYVYNLSTGTYGWQWIPTGEYRYQGTVFLEQQLPTGGSISISSMLYKRDYFIGSSSDSLQTEYSNVVQFSVQQPLFQPNNVLINQRRNRLNLESARLSQEIRLRDLDYVIALVYYSLVRADQSLKLEQKDYERWRKSVEVAEAKYKAGLIPEVEVLKLRVELERREGTMASTYGNYLNTTDNLKLALGLKLDDSISVVPEVDKITIEMREIKTALKMRQELQKANIDVENAEINYKQVKSNYGLNTQIRAYYNFDAKRPYLSDLTENYEQDRGLTLSITFPLWDWRAAHHNLQVNQIAWEKARYNLEQQQKSYYEEMLQAQRNLEAAESRLKSARLAAELAQKSYDITNARFESGSITSTDLIDAQISLNQSQQDLLNSLIDYNIAAMKYKTLFFPEKIGGPNYE